MYCPCITVPIFCFLILFTFTGVSGQLEEDVEGIKLRLVDMENILFNQMKVIADQEARMVSQEEAIAQIMSHLTTAKTTKESSSKEVYFTKPSEDPSLEDRVYHLEEVSKIKVLRTCDEMEKHGIKKSGFYNLDPDGDMIGNPPIQAYCDFENNPTVTEIIHDADNELTDITHCDGNLCYARDIVYTSPMGQIKSLMALSTFCHQSIEFDCYMAPLNQGDVQVGVWTDRHGEDQIYFDGQNYGEHLCSCHTYNNCTGEEALHNKCNCDNNSVPDWMQDLGLITNMTALPVMAFKYGPLTYQTQKAKFRVGRLRCGGMKQVNNVPQTCRDLKMLGETRPGLYHLGDVQHSNYPKMSFCQLDEPGYEDDLELESHWVKLSSGPGQVFFAVKHSGTNDIRNGAIISFDVIEVNEGKAMNPSSGIFTAPVDGVYDFKVSALAYLNTGITYVNVYLNDEIKSQMYVTNTYGYNSMNRAFQLILKQGDEIKLKKHSGGIDGSLCGLYFIGMLL